MKRLFILICFLFFQCASTIGTWSNYSTEYFGTEVARDKFLKELDARKCEYRVQTLERLGVYEVQYRDSVKKD